MRLQMSECGFYTANLDVGLWLNLHVLPMSASFNLMMAFAILGKRHFTIKMCYLNTGSPGWFGSEADNSMISVPSDSSGQDFTCNKQQNWMCKGGGREEGA